MKLLELTDGKGRCEQLWFFEEREISVMNNLRLKNYLEELEYFRNIIQLQINLVKRLK
jgi:hypothetical protein